MSESKTLTDARRYAQIIESGGLSGTHKQTLAWVPPGSRVLELGCATGYIGKLLIEQKGCRVTGAEADPEAAREARAAGLEVLEGSLEDPAFRASLGESFDVVIATDVLEHLTDPAAVLLQARSWLKPQGLVILAVPNVATWSMRVQLMLRGDFEYQESGLLDRTHLHFFTYETLLALVTSQGWRVLETMFDGYEIPAGNHLLRSWPEAFRRWLHARTEAAPPPAHLLGVAGLEIVDFVNRTRNGIGTKLARQFPNLCAPHISLLLGSP